MARDLAQGSSITVGRDFQVYTGNRGALCPISLTPRPDPAEPAPRGRTVDPTRAGPSGPARKPTGQLQLNVPAEAGKIAAVRRAVAAWATQMGLALDTVEDLVVATYEALANAVDHAYPSHPGTVSVTAWCTEHEVIVVVGDHGRWRPAPAPGGRGRGLVLIRHLAHHIDLYHDTSGTTLRMTWRPR